MLVIAILKINKMAAPGTLTFMVSREHTQRRECRAAACVAWHRSVQLAFSQGKVPGASYQLSGTVPSYCLTKIHLVQMWSSKDCDSQFLEQGSKGLQFISPG